MFLLDCDGVLWSGSSLIDRSFDVVNWLVKLGKKVFFLTNSSGRTRDDYVDKI